MWTAIVAVVLSLQRRWRYQLGTVAIVQQIVRHGIGKLGHIDPLRSDVAEMMVRRVGLNMQGLGDPLT